MPHSQRSGAGLEGKPVLTMFDYIDFDEGRDPVAVRAWEGKAPEQPR